MLDSQGKTIKIKVGFDGEPVPDGKYTCLVQSVKMVNSFNSFKGENQDLLSYRLQILDDVEIPEKLNRESTRGRLLWKRCSLSLSNKSWLYKLACATEGHELTKEELEAFDPEQLCNKQVSCLVNQAPGKDGNVYNNIVSFSKATKKLPLVEEKVVEKQSRSAFEAPALESPEATDFSKLSLDDVLGKKE